MVDREELSNKIMELKKRVDSGDVVLTEPVVEDLEKVKAGSDGMVNSEAITPEIMAAIKSMDINKK